MLSSTNYVWPNYWHQLSVMIGAGLTVESALSSLVDSTSSKNKRINAKLKRVIGLVGRGQNLSQALKQTGCIVEADFTILNIAEKSGKLPHGLNAIALRRLDWHRRVDNLKANLFLPKGILLVGALAGLFVRMASAGQTFSEAFSAISTVLMVAWLFLQLTVWLVERDTLLWLSLGWRVPLFRRRWLVYQLAFEEAFYRLLSWQIAAGIAPDKALKANQNLLSAENYQSQTISAARMLSTGGSVDDVLVKVSLILSKPLKRVLLTSMQVGSWDRAVIHHLDLQKSVLALKADEFFKWLPRLYYFVALLAISKFMFV